MTFVKLQSLELLKLNNKCSYKTEIMFSCTSHQTHVHHIDFLMHIKGLIFVIIHLLIYYSMHEAFPVWNNL